MDKIPWYGLMQDSIHEQKGKLIKCTPIRRNKMSNLILQKQIAVMFTALYWGLSENAALNFFDDASKTQKQMFLDYADKVIKEVRQELIKAIFEELSKPCPHPVNKGYPKRECTVCCNKLRKELEGK